MTKNGKKEKHRIHDSLSNDFIIIPRTILLKNAAELIQFFSALGYTLILLILYEASGFYFPGMIVYTVTCAMVL